MNVQSVFFAVYYEKNIFEKFLILGYQPSHFSAWKVRRFFMPPIVP